jgi:hypothetical protein
LSYKSMKKVFIILHILLLYVFLCNQPSISIDNLNSILNVEYFIDSTNQTEENYQEDVFVNIIDTAFQMISERYLQITAYLSTTRISPIVWRPPR